MSHCSSLDTVARDKRSLAREMSRSIQNREEKGTRSRVPFPKQPGCKGSQVALGVQGLARERLRAQRDAKRKGCEARIPFSKQPGCKAAGLPLPYTFNVSGLNGSNDMKSA